MELQSMKKTDAVTGGILGKELIINGRHSKPDKSTENLAHSNKNSSFIEKCSYWIQQKKRKLKLFRTLLLLFVYFGYYSYAMYCHFGDEASIRLTVFTVFGTFLISWNLLMNSSASARINYYCSELYSCTKFGRRPVVIKWILYVVFGGAMVVYVIVNIALKEPAKLISLGGIVCFLLISFLFSNNKRKITRTGIISYVLISSWSLFQVQNYLPLNIINYGISKQYAGSQIPWHTVFWGMTFQFLLGVFILKASIGQTIVLWFAERLEEMLAYAEAGSIFMFGTGYMEHRFAFLTLPTIIFFVTIVTVLQYLGVVQAIVRTLGRFLAFCLSVSAPEAINASANIFLGGGESSVLVLQYLDSVPVSHLFTFMTSGAASCGGAALIQFMSFGVPAKYLLAASVMSAPAALVCAKVMYPDDEDKYHLQEGEIDVKVEPDQQNEVKADDKKKHQDNAKGKAHRRPKSVVEAVVVGARQGLKMVANLSVTLIVFLAFLEFADATVEWLGDRVDVHGLSMTLILSYVFYPFAFVMGVESNDCFAVGELLGIRTLSVAGVAYLNLANLVKNNQQFDTYTSVYNNTWSYRGKDIYLQQWNTTLQGGILSERSTLIATYALCGFASIVTVGLGLGSLGALAPRRISDFSKVAPWAVVSGTIASYLTACVAASSVVFRMEQTSCGVVTNVFGIAKGCAQLILINMSRDMVFPTMLHLTSVYSDEHFVASV